MALTDILVLLVVIPGTAGAAVLLRREGIRGNRLFAGVWLSFYGLTLVASMLAHNIEILYRVTAGRAASSADAPIYNFRLYSLLLLGTLLIWLGVVCLRAAPGISRGSAEARRAAIGTSIAVALIVAPLIPLQALFGIALTVLSLATLLILALAAPALSPSVEFRARKPFLHIRSRDPNSRESVAPLLPLLTHVSDLQAADWLKASVTSFAETVASFLPGHFEAYARVNHPPEPLRHPPEPIGSLPPDLIDPLIDHLKPATTTPANCFFAVWEGFGGLIVPPDLEPKLDLPHRRYHVFTGPVAAAHMSFGDVPFHHQSANIWWPADQAWCVATEIDLSQTYVGGSQRCIASILADPRLGAIETTAATVHD